MQKIILSMGVNVTSISAVVENIRAWAGDSIGRYVCVSNVHMCMETFDSSSFQEVVNGANLIMPDGLPLVWAQKLLGNKEAKQVRGADLMLALCAMAAKENIPIGLFGVTPELLQVLKNVLHDKFPGLIISFSESPPFREMTTEESQQYVETINMSGASILFVGLGCPKQEKWMKDHKRKLHCTMLGVGAAFDYIAGNKKHPPRWMQKIGLEWLFRLATEPKRLWKRYLKHNPRFIYYFILQLLGKKYV